jgi:hypothetical protein
MDLIIKGSLDGFAEIVRIRLRLMAGRARLKL